MPTLLDVQNALRRSLVDGADGEAAGMLAEKVPADRLDIYRNTFIIGVTKALRLSFPAVHRLVGDDFFAAAADLFIAAGPPRAACLDLYGAGFPEFLQQFPPAASLPYIADVARLEWAVSRAMHAPDREPVALTDLAALTPGDQASVRFLPHPSLGLLRSSHPVDVIWRAVLEGDDAALATLGLEDSPVHLLVQRQPTGVEAIRLDESEWRFAAALFAEQPLQTALDAVTGIDHVASLARHFTAERFVGFNLAPPNRPAGHAA